MAYSFVENFVATPGTDLNGFNDWVVNTGVIDIEVSTGASGNSAAHQNSNTIATCVASKADSGTITFPFSAAYTVTQGGHDALGQTFGSGLGFGATSALANRGIYFEGTRSDSLHSDSTITVYDDTTSVASKLTSFQFVSEITLTLIINLDGSGSLTVVEGLNTDSVTWDAHSWSNTTGGYVGLLVTTGNSSGILRHPYLSAISAGSTVVGLSYNAGTEGILTIAPLRGTQVTPILDGSSLTSTQTYTLPDASGTIQLTDGDVATDSLTIGSGDAITAMAASTYTPTVSAKTNLDSATATDAQYMQVGTVVTVSGQFTADPTTTSTATSFELSLPVSTTLSAIEQVSGVANAGGIASMSAQIIGSVTNGTAVFEWVATDVTSQSWSYVLTYLVS